MHTCSVGLSLVCLTQLFVCAQFVERLKSKPPTKEMKIQLMHDIAQEFSIEWDSRALEQKLYTNTPPASDEVCLLYASLL